jgi:AcrR family transcriptional regulator
MTDPRPTSDALLDGAMTEFYRHGFAKSSMADVARASGISRTSLYNHFATKEDVFRALSERINARVYDAVIAALRGRGAWDERLLRVVNARVSWVYELLHTSEYGRELINEKNRICGGGVLAANDRFAALVADLLAQQFPKRADTASLARILIQSVNGVLESAETKEGAETNVALLLQVFCRGL